MKSNHSNSRLGTTMVVLLLFLIGVWFTDQERSAISDAKPVAVLDAERVPSPVVAALPPWSEVQPANHGTNPIPDGFVQTAVYEDVARLAFPTPAPVGAGLRARVLLGEISGATGRHKFVRIEEVASIKENRLVERRVMPADHLVVYAQQGKTEAEVRAGLPQGYVIRKKLLGDRRYLIGFESKNADSLEIAAKALNASPVLTSAVPDGYVFSSSIPNDPLFNQQWGLHNTGQTVNGTAGTPDADIDAPEAWDLTTGNSAVTVAVIDSGIDLTHEDLIDNIWTNPGESGGGKATNGIDDDGNGLIDDVHGWDFVNDDNVPQDDFGHGTHVAGIIGAKGNNGVGVAGVCWNVGLVAIKALGSSGNGLWSDVTDTVRYAGSKGARVANLSLGSYGSAPLGVETEIATQREMAIVAAAGNGVLTDNVRRGDNIDEIPFVPAALALDNIVAVAACDNQSELSTYSNFGEVSVDLIAPGNGIVSTWFGGGYETKSGTSMAAGFVSGALAQALVRDATLPPVFLLHALKTCVRRQWQTTGKTHTEAHLWAARLVGFAGSGVRWSQISTNALGGCVHIQPNGTIRRWGRSVARAAGQAGWEVPDTWTSARGLALFDAALLDYDQNLWMQLPGLDQYERVVLPSKSLDYVASRFVLCADGNVYFRNLQTINNTFPAYQGDAAAALVGIQSATHICAAYSGGVDYNAYSSQVGYNLYARTASGEVFRIGRTSTSATVISGLQNVRRIFATKSRLYAVLDSGQVFSRLHLDSAVLVQENSLANLADVGGVPANFATYGSAGVLAAGTLGFSQAYPVNPAPAALYRSETVSDGCAVISRYGEAYEWGLRIQKVLPGSSNTIPRKILAPRAVVAVTGGSTNKPSIALLADGRTISWGSNANGGLGRGNLDMRAFPAPVDVYHGAVQIGCGSQRGTVASFPDGRLIHRGSSGSENVSLPNHQDVAMLKFRNRDLTIVTSTGHVDWLTMGEYIGNRRPFYRIGGLENILDAGYFLVGSTPGVLALRNDGRIFFARSVANPNGATFDIPVDVTPTELDGPGAMPKWSLFPSGNALALLYRQAAGLWVAHLPTASGPLTLRAVTSSNVPLAQALANSVGQLSGSMAFLQTGVAYRVNAVLTGTPSLSIYTGFDALHSSSPMSSVAAGCEFTADTAFCLASLANGRVYAAGANTSGQLGVINFNFTAAASEIVGLSDVVQVWGGTAVSYARKADGSVLAWGNNFNDQLGFPVLGQQDAATLSFGGSEQVLATYTDVSDWLNTYFSREEIGSINISGDEADPDRDGLVNLVEYALGSDPTLPSDGDGEEAGLACSFETVSSEALSADGNGNGDGTGELHFTVKLKRRAKRPGIEYRVEFSDDMVTWTSSPTRLLKVLESEKTVIFRDVEPLSVTQRRWARLVIRKGN